MTVLRLSAHDMMASFCREKWFKNLFDLSVAISI